MMELEALLVIGDKLYSLCKENKVASPDEENLEE